MPYPAWPQHHTLQPEEVAREYAQLLAPWGKAADDGSISSLLMAARLGISTKTSGPSASFEAFLIPNGGGGFRIPYNPYLPDKYRRRRTYHSLEEKEADDRIWVDFVIAHELAHTFYSSWRPLVPSQSRDRLWLGTPSDPNHTAVEAFCDAFAYYLVTLSGTPANHMLARLLIRSYDYNETWIRRMKPLE
jgi:hypothetical protein